jgi:CheY-like chemotaxis protein
MRKYALVVHPDPAARLLMERWIRKSGYETLSVRRGDEAILFAQTGDIDLIVLDRRAPHSECSDVILKLLSDPKSACIPIAFANADARQPPILAISRMQH